MRQPPIRSKSFSPTPSRFGSITFSLFQECPLGNQCDNCPAIENVSQADIENDGRGDACDLFIRFVLDFL